MRRLHWIAYGAVLIVAGLGLRQMWLQHYESNLVEMREGIGEKIRRVDNLIDAGNSHVNMLRISADDMLTDIKQGGISVSPLFHQLKAVPEIGGYCTDRNGQAREQPPVSLSGLGNVPAAGTRVADEINMALLLYPQFAATAENIPTLAWAYYTSASRFVVLYPFAACKDFHFADDLLEHEFFKLGLPQFNADRHSFWTEAYMDEAGKGLMATVGAPVYDGGRFLGTVAIDLTLAVLSDFVRDPEDRLGTAFIVNQQGQVLAHPTLIDPADTAAHRIEEAFGDVMPNPMQSLLSGPDDKFVALGDALVYSSPLRGAPWRFVYVADRGSLVRQAFLDSRLEIVGFLLLVLLIAAFDGARRAVLKQRQSVAELTRTQTKLEAERDRAERAETAARQANLAKSVMLANASHDLRTPLNAIIGFSELALTNAFGPIGSPKYEEYLRDIHASGNLLLAIVNDVLDLSKIEAGRFEMKEQSIDVAELVRMCGHLVETQARQGGIDLRMAIATDLPALRADLRAMHQILLNLLSNAVKFTPAGGAVLLRAARAGDGGLEIEVSDTGKGMSADDLELVFTPFSRGASAATANTQGTGLGLSIVKALIELHGGRISIASTPDAGTKVLLHLPADRLRQTAGNIAA